MQVEKMRRYTVGLEAAQTMSGPPFLCVALSSQPNSSTLPKTPSQLIRHRLLPFAAAAQEATQEPAALTKAAPMVGCWNAERFGNMH